MSDIGEVHLIGAWIALGCGFINLLAPKGTPGHRAIGYGFVFCMLLTNATALSLYRLNGHFNMFHGFALVSLAATLFAIAPALRRGPGWLRRHSRGMQGAYVGLCAAATNEILTRIVARNVLLSHAAFCGLSVGVTLLVILCGGWLAWRRERVVFA